MIGLSPRRIANAGFAALAFLVGLPLAAAAQNAVVRGTITSAERGSPLPNINVVITALNISVYTNEQGLYTFTVPAARIPAGPATITARGIGYRSAATTRILQPGAELVVDFQLATDVSRLEEIIVTGVQEGIERSKVPFSVGRVTAEDMPVPAVDPIRALQGKAAGVRIASTTGRPGATPEILLRGPTSINAQNRGQGPLIVVDDAILNVGSLEELGGLDIESIEVVKGAAGASMYGARAANGVISIRTRRGATGADQVRFNIRTEYGVQDLGIEFGFPHNHHLQLSETGQRFCVALSGNLCGRTFNWMREILRINNFAGDTTRTPQATIFSSSGNVTDLRNVYQANIWPGEYYYTPAAILDIQPVVMTSVDMTGKVGNVSFYVSGAYQDEPGAVRFLRGIQQRRARVNIDYQARTDLKVSVSTMFTNLSNDLRGFGWGALLRGTPAGTNYLARDTLGRLLVRGGGSPLRGTGNGGAGIHYNGENYAYDRESNRFLGSLTARYFPADWVTLEGTFAYDSRARRDKEVVPKGYRTQAISTALNNGQMWMGNLRTESMNAALTATFRHNFSDDLNAKVSFRGIYDEINNENNTGEGQIFRVVGIEQLSNLSTNYAVSSSLTTTKNAGLFAGATLDYKDRYIVEGSFRYDGSSRFGAGNRWAPFGRVSAVWRVSEEPFWTSETISQFRLRASRGTAGSAPQFSAQYETYSVTATGISLGQAGNSKLKPETTTEYEVGADFELFRKIGVELTYAYGLTKDQILNVGTPASLGFSNQWQNAGTLENRTWELGVTVPVVNSRSLYWQMRGTWDRNRTYIKELFVPEFIFTGGTGQGTASFFRMREGERLGTIYGGRFLKSCSELPADFWGRNDCGGATSSFQINDEGWLVWVGTGNSWRDGITRNLWGTILPVAQSPYGRALSFGHPIMMANPDAPAANQQFPLGNTLPDFRFTFANDIQYKRLTLYALLDATIGHYIHNQSEAWGLLDFQSAQFDQRGKSVETAKPVGYSWRCGPPCNGSGTGGFYDALGPNNYNTENGSYAKLREVSLTYKVGPVGGVGDWTVGLVGRNLLTITNYSGYDPETGVAGGSTGSGLINQVDAFDFPTLRSFTFSLSTRF
jgi:TonB-linked SusC/RagA family outer membrane protein